MCKPREKIIFNRQKYYGRKIDLKEQRTVTELLRPPTRVCLPLKSKILTAQSPKGSDVYPLLTPIKVYLAQFQRIFLDLIFFLSSINLMG